jgi:hypothetical protein
MKRGVFALCAGLLLAGLIPGSALGAATLDQSNTGAYTISWKGGMTFAQSVTAGLAGTLVQVDLYLADSDAGGGPATVKIEGVQRSAGYPPNNNVQATGSTTVTTEGWYSFALSPAISLLAGGHFNIVIALGNPQTLYSTGDAYPHGQVWLWNGSTWQSPGANSDFDFRSWMIAPTPTPTPAPTAAPTPTPASGTKTTPKPTAKASSSSSELAASESATAALISEASSSSGASVASPTSGVQGAMATANTPSAAPGLGSSSGDSGGSPLPIVAAIIVILAAGGGLWFLLMRRRRTADSTPTAPPLADPPPADAGDSMPPVGH